MNPALPQKSAGKRETAGSQGYEKIKAVKNVRLPAWCWWPQAAEQRGGDGEAHRGCFSPSVQGGFVMDTHHVGEILLSV